MRKNSIKCIHSDFFKGKLTPDLVVRNVRYKKDRGRKKLREAVRESGPCDLPLNFGNENIYSTRPRDLCTS